MNRRTVIIAVVAGLAVVVLAGVALWAWSVVRPRTADELFEGIAEPVRKEAVAAGLEVSAGNQNFRSALRRLREDGTIVETPEGFILADRMTPTAEAA